MPTFLFPHLPTQGHPVSVLRNRMRYDLYPDPEDQNISEERSRLKGTITDVNFLNGVMVINDESGESVVVQFYPLETSSYTHNQLRLALEPGRSFNGVVARAGASTVDLYSATIIANKEN